MPEISHDERLESYQWQRADITTLNDLAESTANRIPKPNRLKVALSRAQSLAIVVGHPGLAATRCNTLEQMKLVDLYCRIVGMG